MAAARKAPVSPAKDVADFHDGVELRLRALFVTPDSKVKAKWGELRLSNSADATWEAKVGNDTLTIPLATTTIAPADKPLFMGVARFNLTLADGKVQPMSVYAGDAGLVNAVFGEAAE
ncbi:hypothetical protein WN71_025905 [Streptomyces mangrovisoli]|uniref:Uncharacterized protein n=1 Tax=Streptomyces mangrovisoli TaxID=1428628 RepID=A0A1J4NRT6_9ACTN|nr:hypothetical protein WN71_025905 [Streptomyces mangrovisoli]